MQRNLDPITAADPTTPLVHRLVAPDGAMLQVTEIGNRHHPAVLLCLPVGIRPAPVQPLIGALISDYRVLVSQSRWVDDDSVTELGPEYAVDLAAHAEDVAFIVRELGAAPVHLMGYCCGSLIALAAANRLGDRVRSLTFCNGAYVLREDASEYEQAMLELASRYASRPRMARVVYSTVRERIVGDGGAESVDGEDRTHHFTQFRDFKTFLKYIKAIRGVFVDSTLQQLQPVAVPVLALSGARDGMTPPSQFDTVSHLLPGATHHVLEEEDHYLPCRASSHTIALMRNFLSASDTARNEGIAHIPHAVSSREVLTTVLTRADVGRIVAAVGTDRLMDATIRKLQAALQAFDPVATELRLRDGFRYRTPCIGLVEWMPLLARGSDVVVKLVGYHPANPKLGLATVQASLARVDTQTGCLTALVEGSFATALRTGAASAIATRLCASPISRVVGLVGCGAQAVTQLHALSRVLRIERVLVHDIDAGARASFAARVAFLRLPVYVASLETVEHESDVLCSATSVDVGAGPVICGEQLQPHVHINAVGSDLPGKIELPRELLLASFVVPDYPEQARLEGECQQLQPEHIGPALHELVKRPELAAEHRCSRTVFDSTGYALEDRVVLDVLLAHASALGIGQRLDLASAGVDPRDPYTLAPTVGEALAV